MVRDGTVSGDMYGDRIYHDPCTFTQGNSGPNGQGKVWYVDGTNGTTGGTGKSWKTAMNTISLAVAAASAGDTIYVTAKAITDATGDPTSYAETIIIPLAKSSLSIIGVSRGRTQGGLPQIKIGAGSTALLTVRAAGCLIANLGFNGISSTGGGILLDDDNSTKTAFGTTIVNCHIKNCVGSVADSAVTGGGIMWSTEGNAWQVLIRGCRFYKNVADITLMGTSNTRPQDVVIEDCDFSGYAEFTDCNIFGTGTGSGFGSIKIDNCRFGQLPALGGTNDRYFDLTGTLSGTVTNCTFGCNTGNTGTTLTFLAAGTAGKLPTTVHIMNCYGQSETATETGEITIGANS
jgi:hypothetical protein